MKAIVTTTINSPTIAIEKFDALDDWTLIVVGDKKTPEDYYIENGIYLCPKKQELLFKDLSNAIGWNCIQRRNIGFAYAYKMGAEIIATVDDDNIPYDNWGKNLLIDKEIEVDVFDVESDVFDPIGASGKEHLWHRGFPLQLLPDRDYSKKRKEVIKPKFQADFWNVDPDIDAVCRMIHKPTNIVFDDDKFPFSSNKFSPFNSQNTFFTREVIKDYFMFPFIGRMDDIWASYYVQSLGHRVVYNKATVYQDRNKHNVIEDMKKEYLGYENNLRLIKDLYVTPNSLFGYLPTKSLTAFQEYRRIFE